MSEIKNHTRYSGPDRRAPRGDAAKGAQPSMFKAGGRHGAITTNLYNWHSYKNWAEKARGSWEDKK